MNEIEWITDPMDALEAMLKSNFWCYRTDEEIATMNERLSEIVEENRQWHMEDTETKTQPPISTTT